MRILILGGDGYLGWPTAMHLQSAGHDVGLVDNFARRAIDDELGTSSLVPVHTLDERVERWAELTGVRLPTWIGDLVDPDFTHRVVREFDPDCILHYAEQKSAPYSMIDQAHAVHTQAANVVGNLNVLYAILEHNPDIHLLKLGTMGEYGTPNIDIEEGWLTVEHRGRTDTVLFPKKPGSMYHLSKVHDSHNIEFACRVWGLRATDLNQGVVYGNQTAHTSLDPVLATRFDYDDIFGTVLNRMVVQAVLGLPLTVYGSGGQTRGFINIIDTVECIRLAAEHPPEAGEYRVFNQFTEQLSVRQIADAVAAAYPGPCTVEQLDNPRVEQEQHHYRAAHTRLLDLGLVPHLIDRQLLEGLFAIAHRHRDRADLSVIMPKVRWRQPAGDQTPTA